MKTVGVLGGMGPAATLDFLAKLQAATGAKVDQDHVPLIIDLNPQVEDRNASLRGEGPSPGDTLVRMAKRTEAAGAKALVIVCNSAHPWAGEIQAAVSIPLINLVEETADAVLGQAPGARRAGLLAATAALDARLYQEALAARGLDPITLDDQGRARFMALLYKLKGGQTGADERAEMRALAQRLIDAGAQALVSACTEVPLVFTQADAPIPLIDSTDVLVARTLAFARS